MFQVQATASDFNTFRFWFIYIFHNDLKFFHCIAKTKKMDWIFLKLIAMPEEKIKKQFFQT